MNVSIDQSIDGFAQSLVDAELISNDKLNDAISHAENESLPLINYLSVYKIIDEKNISKIAATHYGLPLYDLNVHDDELIPKDLLELDIVQKYFGLPILRKEGHLIVAVSDPNSSDIHDLGFVTGYKVEQVLVNCSTLREKIDNLINLQALNANNDISEDELEAVEVSDYDSEMDLSSAYDVNDMPVVKFVNKIIIGAIQSKSSDLHFEPYENFFRVRYRQDGILHEVAKPPIKLASAIVARLKVMAKLDISERRVPQDGRFKLSIVKGQSIDFRISTCPTLYGEKVVIRILDSGISSYELSSLGMEDFQQQAYIDAIAKPQGMILVTGPTGSGKTVSLYSALRMLNSPETNISTIEDPVEIYMQGINQVQVNEKTGMTFATALRAFLRQDPDIIMVGEIRDFETAEIAIKAAQTGHLVLSTLHTNSATLAITRLMNIGVQAYNIASSLKLVMAQRLARRLCPHCKVEADYDKDYLLHFGFKESVVNNNKLYKAKGCDRCVNGFKGRVGIYEVLPVEQQLQKLIMDGKGELEFNEEAQNRGIINLRQAGILKVQRGETSLEEMKRVIST